MKKQLLYSLISIVLLLSAFGYFSITKMIELSNVTKKMYEHPFVVTNATKSIEALALSIELEMLHLKEHNLDKSEFTRIIQEIQQREQKIDELYHLVLERYLGDKSDIEKNFSVFKETQIKHKEVFDLYEKEGHVPTQKIFHNHFVEDRYDIQSVIDFADNKAHEFFSHSTKIREEVLTLTLTSLLGVFLLILIGGYFIGKNITQIQTSLLRQKKELSDVNLRMELAQDSAQFGIWDLDLRNNLLTWDKWMLDIYGVEEQIFIPTVEKWMSSLHPSDRERTIDIFNDAVAGNSEYKLTFQIIGFDGKERYIQASALVLRDENNQPYRMVGINYDISSIKRSENMLRERDIQLMQQSRLAQMGEMVSMIAHQWRQPLAAISAAALDLKLKFQFDVNEITVKEKKDLFVSSSVHSLDEIDSFVQTLTHTIDDFRTFYKPNKFPGTFLIHQTLEKALKIVLNSLDVQGIKVLISCQKNIEVHIFENELIQVILNILKNAQDNFGEKKIINPEIKIECLSSEDNVFLNFTDNGGGIPEQIIDRIFEPYFTTKDEKNGTGLGLYMSKSIIEEHHKGKFFVKNLDKGCQFSIMLPTLKESDYGNEKKI